MNQNKYINTKFDDNVHSMLMKSHKKTLRLILTKTNYKYKICLNISFLFKHHSIVWKIIAN
jgi:hypothetical protein